MVFLNHGLVRCVFSSSVLLSWLLKGAHDIPSMLLLLLLLSTTMMLLFALFLFFFVSRSSHRFAARFALKNHVFENEAKSEQILRAHLQTIKRVVFTRSLRLLPLPAQTAVVEALAVIISAGPKVLPLDDQHVLAFLSEFLKLSSIADGEMIDANMSGFVVNKDGFAANTPQTTALATRTSPSLAHMTSVFLRRECILCLSDKVCILVPEELPQGIQLRVSALRLFNTVIRRHADPFFDADQKTPIGACSRSLVFCTGVYVPCLRLWFILCRSLA